MKNINKYYFIIILILGFSLSNCKEEIDIEDVVGFESTMVVEARITNELKYHEIYLSTSKKFDSDDFPSLSNATVRIETDNHIIYDYHETSPGKYISDEEFKAESGIKYQLLIDRNNGESYLSNLIELTNVTQIDELSIIRETTSYGTDGIAIRVNSYDASGKSRYYKYEYEETYKIIAPYWTLKKMIQDDFMTDPQIVYKTVDKQICYKTNSSIQIIQYETTGLQEDKVTNFTARFISKDNPVISHRYSILIKQYIQSQEAFSYFKTLDELSGSGNLFSQNQPGFIDGNIRSNLDRSKKVIGFFEVSSVSKKRIYLNYVDYFPNENLPPYFIDCEMFAPNSQRVNGSPSVLDGIIQSNDWLYYIDNYDYPDPNNESIGPYLFVKLGCGDCTEIGDLEIPEFWEE